MRYVLIVLGLVLIGVGIAIWFGRLSYPDRNETIKIGDYSASLTERRPIPQWLGGMTALTGLAIALLGMKYRP